MTEPHPETPESSEPAGSEGATQHTPWPDPVRWPHPEQALSEDVPVEEGLPQESPEQWSALEDAADPQADERGTITPDGWEEQQPSQFDQAPHALSVEGLTVFFATDAGPVQALKGISYEVAQGEILAVVGESGSGKSVSVRAVLGMLPENSHRSGVIRVDGHDVAGWSEKRMREVRGSEVSMVFQEPGAALDPLFTVGDQIVETIRAHQKISRKAAKARAVELLDLVRLPDPQRLVRRYPHELSGGQKQRVAIAMAISCDPKVILADEPTTALDVTVQAEILKLLADLRDRIGTAIVFITHNLGVVANFADRVVVMRSGEVVESGTVREVFAHPASDYTRALLAATPRLDVTAAPESDPPVSAQLDGGADPAQPWQEATQIWSGPLVPSEVLRPAAAAEPEPDSDVEAAVDETLEAAKSGQLTWPEALSRIKALKGDGPSMTQRRADREALVDTEASSDGATDPVVPAEPVAAQALVANITDLVVAYHGRAGSRAVDGVSLEILPGETIGLVGESGSGKSTIARCLAGLQKPSSGRLELLGHDLAGSARKLRPLRAGLGYVFQDPATCLNPRMTVGECVGEPLVVHRGLQDRALAKRVRALLDGVALPAGAEQRYPHELSGGQRQRASLARALALEPKLVIADEPTSALDVSVQAKVLDLFAQLRAEHGFACLFISHDLAVVDQLCDRIVVLRGGKVVESGTRDQVLRNPAEEYTRKLIAAVPDPQPEWLRTTG